MKNKRIIFMGTPDFACAILQRLIDEDYQVVAVVSQPDKKVGRKQEVTMTPVKTLALKYHLPVLQPVHIKTDYEEILAYKPDCIVTCAYGQIIPDVVLNAPTHGSVNVHASLLPKLRGGAPIHKAIITGEKESGVSIMRMVKKMDAGAVCGVSRVLIEDDDTMGVLHDKLAVAGANVLMEELPRVLEDKAVFVSQDESKVTYAWNISKEEEKIDLSQSVDCVYNQVRGLIPYPVGYFFLDGKKVKIHKATKIVKNHEHAVGECVEYSEGSFKIACLGGYLCIEELQVEGKTKAKAKDFYNGLGKTWIGKGFN